MSGKVPPSSRAGKRRGLSPLAHEQVQRAARLYERFSGHDTESLEAFTAPPLPKVAVKIGTCDFIGYTTIRDGVREKYIHKFRASDKPFFCVSPDGMQIMLVAGRYKFTERGIVDISDKSA